MYCPGCRNPFVACIPPVMAMVVVLPNDGIVRSSRTLACGLQPYCARLPYRGRRQARRLGIFCCNYLNAEKYQSLLTRGWLACLSEYCINDVTRTISHPLQLHRVD